MGEFAPTYYICNTTTKRDFTEQSQQQGSTIDNLEVKFSFEACHCWNLQQHQCKNAMLSLMVW
jgi:hypothetical protein